MSALLACLVPKEVVSLLVGAGNQTRFFQQVPVTTEPTLQSLMCLCTMYVPSACGGQKMVSEPRELELQMVLLLHCQTQEHLLKVLLLPRTLIRSITSQSPSDTSVGRFLGFPIITQSDWGQENRAGSGPRRYHQDRSRELKGKDPILHTWAVLSIPRILCASMSLPGIYPVSSQKLLKSLNEVLHQEAPWWAGHGGAIPKPQLSSSRPASTICNTQYCLLIFYFYLWVHVSVPRRVYATGVGGSLKKKKKALVPPGAGVTGSWEPANKGAGNWTLRSSKEQEICF